MGAQQQAHGETREGKAMSQLQRGQTARQQPMSTKHTKSHHSPGDTSSVESANIACHTEERKSSLPSRQDHTKPTRRCVHRLVGRQAGPFERLRGPRALETAGKKYQVSLAGERAHLSGTKSFALVNAASDRHG